MSNCPSGRPPRPRSAPRRRGTPVPAHNGARKIRGVPFLSPARSRPRSGYRKPECRRRRRSINRASPTRPTPALLATTVRSAAPCSIKPSINALGWPMLPRPPISTTAPSRIPAIASAKLCTILLIMASVLPSPKVDVAVRSRASSARYGELRRLNGRCRRTQPLWGRRIAAKYTWAVPAIVPNIRVSFGFYCAHSTSRLRGRLLRAGCGLCHACENVSEAVDHGGARGFDAMPLRQPVRIVVGNPRLPGGVLPDQDLEGQIDADGLLRLHQRRAAFGVAEDQEIGRVEAQTDRSGAGRMIDMGEFCQALAFYLRLEPVHRFHWPVLARYGYQSLCGHGRLLLVGSRCINAMERRSFKTMKDRKKPSMEIATAILRRM